MSQRDVNDFLEKGMYGTPQLKPDEQRKYLGTFRERIFLSMTIQEMKQNRHATNLATELNENPGHQLLINAGIGSTLQNKYMQVAQKANVPFKIVDADNQQKKEAIGLVYIAHQAVNVDIIAISQKYPVNGLSEQPSIPKKDTEPEKESWLKKFFS